MASVTIPYNNGSGATSVALPPGDSFRLIARGGSLQNGGCWVAFGDNTVTVTAGAVDSILIMAGNPLFIATNATHIAAVRTGGAGTNGVLNVTSATLFGAAMHEPGTVVVGP